MPYFLQMALNNAWANATLYTAFQDLAPGAFSAPRPGFFPSLAETMNHIYEVDLYYIDALEEGGQGLAVYNRQPISDHAVLGQMQVEADMRFARFCQQLSEDDLSRRVRTARPHDPDVTERIDALILHLVQHQIHHRGQAHVQLQEAGVMPPQLDEFHLEDDRAPTARAYFP
ncbi:DinB family protein [Pseudooceanicola sp. LIPI14-2-Ac024]|uniref:DinB family protein n=1 Tax=Pseudooceanicola sp. LIPI14-2-Ac024 TaxID=3344875 RepID=UPI0035D015D4